jgi:dynactin complex subunit
LQAKEENACLSSHVNGLNSEIMELRCQLAELKKKQEADADEEEADFQRRLAVSFCLLLLVCSFIFLVK